MKDDLERNMNPVSQDETPGADAEQTAAPVQEAGETAQENKVPEKPKKRPRAAKNAERPVKPPLPSKEDLQRELENRKKQLEHTTMEMSARLKQLLSDEIESMRKREKGRAAEILGVFAKHNFYANGFTPVEMRTTLEDLGPTYVKIGQIMSSRVDLLPESYCRELEKLRQNVKELDPEIARAVIEQETGRKIDDIYLEFKDKPLGSASIGQVHYGVLKDGTRVVTKVQRPLIADMMRKDYVLLKKLARLVNIVNEGNEDEDETVDLLSVISEMEKVTEEELDFRVEAENTRFFKAHCIEDENVITCPTVIDDLTTERIFTMTFVDGYSISKKDKLVEEGYDPVAIGRVIVENYVHQVLDVGTFHADPHQGNIMVSHGKPYWIDFGMIGRISEADVNTIQSLILSLLGRDLDAMVNAVMSMGATSPKTNRNRLMEDADVMFDRYMNVTSVNDIDLSRLLTEVTDLCAVHHIKLPGKYTMLVRSIATIEGVIEQLCPELNLFELLSNKLMDRARKNLDVQQELIKMGKDVLEVGRKAVKMPELTYDALNNMVKGRMKMNLELTGYEELLKRGNDIVTDVVLALFACMLFFGSCILCTADIEPKTPNGMPLLAAAGLLFAVGLAIYTVRKLGKKKK